MELGPKILAAALRLRAITVADPELATVSQVEGAAFVLLWMILREHADHEGEEIEALARDQLNSFIEWAREHLTMMRIQ